MAERIVAKRRRDMRSRNRKERKTAEAKEEGSMIASDGASEPTRRPCREEESSCLKREPDAKSEVFMRKISFILYED